MENLEDLFEECSNSVHHIEPEDALKKYADKKLENIEAAYTGVLTAHVEREKEKSEIKNNLNKAEHKLRTIKNPPNVAKMPFKKREALIKDLSKTRDDIRNEISKYKVRLDEIEMEEGEKPVNNKSSKKEGEIKENWKMNEYDEYTDF